MSESIEKPDTATMGSVLRSWRYFFWLLGLCLLVVIFYAEENWRGRRAWEKYKRAMAVAGEPLEPKAFVPPPVDDSQNFAMTPSLASLFEFRPGTQQPSDPKAVELIRGFARHYDMGAKSVKEPKTPGSNSWVTQRLDLPAWQAAFLAASNEVDTPPIQVLATNVSEAQAAAGILEALAECDSLLEEVRTASRRPRSRFNICYDHDDPAGILLPHLSLLKQFCLVLKLRATAELALGRTDAAFEDVELMLYLAEATREEPFLISLMVRIAQVQLALQPLAQGIGQWSDGYLKAFQNRLARFNLPADAKRSLKAERTVLGGAIIEAFRKSPTHYLNLASSLSDGPPGLHMQTVALYAAPRGWFDFERANYSRLFDEHLFPMVEEDKMRITPTASRKGSKELARAFKHSSVGLLLKHRVFSALMLPEATKMSQRVAFGQAGVNSAVIACALERYRRIHNRYPESLQQLCPGFLAKLPHDIITGEPLKYRLTDDGQFVLYSIGWNEIDDGGRIGAMKTPEIGQNEGDWVWTQIN
jgi:hypothetical protein